MTTHPQQRDLFGRGFATCRCCGRPLSDPDSMRRGIGPICRRRHGGEDDGDDPVETFADVALPEPIEPAFILRRRDDGTPATNVPHLVTQHSPTGYEWGYAGSGPADLALNMLEVMIRRLELHTEPVPCWRGECSGLAWQLHQAFKEHFIVRVPYAGAPLRLVLIRAWLRERTRGQV